MLIKTYCAEVMGLEATTITIEVSLTRGVMFHLSGLADTAVKESYDRIRAAIQNVGFKLSPADMTINLSPADIRKEGSGYDLSLAIGILAAHGKVSDERLHDYMLIGELGLDGQLKPVSGILSVAIYYPPYFVIYSFLHKQLYHRINKKSEPFRTAHLKMRVQIILLKRMSSVFPGLRQFHHTHFVMCCDYRSGIVLFELGLYCNI